MTSLVSVQATLYRWPLLSCKYCTRLGLTALFLVCLVIILPRSGYRRSEVKSRKAPELLPLYQLERSPMSRSQALKRLRPVIEFFQKTNCTRPDHCVTQNMLRLGHTLAALGLPDLNKALKVDPPESTSNKNVPTEKSQNSLFLKESSDVIMTKLCSSGSSPERTPRQRRQANTTFCSRLRKYIQEIQDGVRPALLTLYTWLSDSLLDTSQFTRDQMYDNWQQFRPLVQPVLFSDNRLQMFIAQTKGWPCFYIPEYNQDHLPNFKSMATMIREKFTSTFYGYVMPIVYFDVSLLETLIGVNDFYLEDVGHHQKGKKEDENSVSSAIAGTQVIVHGNAIKMKSLKRFNNILDFSNLLDTGGNEVKPGAYVFYTNYSLEQLPEFVADNTLVTSLLLSMTRSSDQVIIDTSKAIAAIYGYQNKTLSLWGRNIPTSKPRDPGYNKRLVEEHLNSQGERRSNRDREPRQTVVTFSENGSLVFSIKG